MEEAFYRVQRHKGLNNLEGRGVDMRLVGLLKVNVNGICDN